MENQELKMQEVKQLRLVDERNVAERENEGWKKTGNVTGSLVEMEYTKLVPVEQSEPKQMEEVTDENPAQ